uniref:Uncharacterized protein LOC104265749 n=1 Tax=Phallusia mammillata TaxID=59560 RepID=A0A6F9DJN8_9ASCI|nr:uncharacterized protein LOC104265749 [Phallusia mammillata]
MVSLCLTNPRLNGVANKGSMPETQKKLVAANKVRQDARSYNARSHDTLDHEINSQNNKEAEIEKQQSDRTKQDGKLKSLPTLVSSDRSPLRFTKDLGADRRHNMLRTLQAMGGVSGRNSRSRSLPATHQYSGHVHDARKDPYRVHKWRLKSGRSLSLQHESSQHTRVPKLHRDLPDVKQQTSDEFRTHGRQKLPPVTDAKAENYEKVNYSKRSLPTVQEDKEGLFCFPNRPTLKKRNKMDGGMLKRLRHSMQYMAQNDFRQHMEVEEHFHVSEFSSPEIKYGEGHREFVKRERRITKWKREGGRNRIQLPPIARRMLKKASFQDQTKPEQFIETRSSDRENIIKLGADRENTNDNIKEITKRRISSDADVFDSGVRESQGISKVTQSPTNALGHSPSHKKTSSSMTVNSTVTVRTVSKDGDTPDSEGSGALKQRRLRRMRTSRTLMTKTDGRGSPQPFRHVKASRMDALMMKWYVAVKTSIWFTRLCKSHRMIVDDSYNISSGSDDFSGVTAGEAKREVLFDVTDYKMKNQLRLSDTTRRILTLASRKRTDKEINLVQAALRNIKAVSDYSTSVQKQIGRHGYFVGFEGKRIVVREGRRPLNYYILLAGSAVVMKEDESGNTNPVQFLKRGDVFGEHEILEDINWEWTVATSGYCEFLVLDREKYQEIFITGGGGGLFTDPDRGKFLRSVSLLNQWPTELLNENPNRCLFRYFKRGALLVKDDFNTEWIYVVKSGSCSVMKMLMVENLSKDQVLRRTKEEQKFKPDPNLTPRLVDKSDAVTEEDHMQALQEKEEEQKNKAHEASVYHQLEMSTILKELNPDVIGLSTSPQANMDEYDHRTELPLSTSRSEIKHKPSSPSTDFHQNPELSKYVQENSANGFRLSRHSDRHPPRTPSPMKAAYLRTGPTPVASRMSLGSENERQPSAAVTGVGYQGDIETVVIDGNVEEAQKQIDLNNFLLSTTSPAVTTKTATKMDQLHPTHINVRKLTKGEVFGVGSNLYNDQPRLSLVSNGAECLMLNKKFYLENASDDCIRGLRETQFPYPSDDELLEQHWRLMAWQAYQSQAIGEVLERRNEARLHVKAHSFV